MTKKIFEVQNYKVGLGHAMSATRGGISIKARGYVTCYGDGYRLIVYGLTDDSPIPDPMFVVQNRVGALFLPFDELAGFVDMVRNEKPVYAYLNSDKPEWISLRTSSEPVGEEES